MAAAAKVLAVLLTIGCGSAVHPDSSIVEVQPQESERSRTRDAWQRPADVLDALGAGPGKRVADIGSGSGYFTARLAQRVGPGGKVYAVDVDPRILICHPNSTPCSSSTRTTSSATTTKCSRRYTARSFLAGAW